jgi:hypothetical protein
MINWNQVGPKGPAGANGQAGPARPQGPQGPQGPAGPTQTLNVQVFGSGFIVILSGQVGQANALPPTGTFVTGGGYESLPAGGVVTSSHPEGNGWFVQAVDPNPAASGPIELQAFALCASRA